MGYDYVSKICRRKLLAWRRAMLCLHLNLQNKWFFVFAVSESLVTYEYLKDRKQRYRLVLILLTIFVFNSSQIMTT